MIEEGLEGWKLLIKLKNIEFGNNCEGLYEEVCEKQLDRFLISTGI